MPFDFVRKKKQKAAFYFGKNHFMLCTFILIVMFSTEILLTWYVHLGAEVIVPQGL